MKLSDLSEDFNRQFCSAEEHEIDKNEITDQILKFDSDMSYGEVDLNVENEDFGSTKFFPRKSNTIMRIAAFGIAAAAVFIVSFEIGNRAKSVIADPDTGFFHWINKDDHTGVSFITNPQGGVGTVDTDAIDKDDVLGIIDEGFYIPSSLPEGMGLHSITYAPETNNYKAYYTDGKDYIEIGSVPRRGYDAEGEGYTYYGSLFTSRNIAEFYTKDKETMGTYPYSGRIYYVKGNLEFDAIKDMTVEYAKHLKGDADEE